MLVQEVQKEWCKDGAGVEMNWRENASVLESAENLREVKERALCFYKKRGEKRTSIFEVQVEFGMTFAVGKSCRNEESASGAQQEGAMMQARFAAFYYLGSDFDEKSYDPR